MHRKHEYATVTVPAAALDRLDLAMSRHLDGDPEAGLKTAVRDLMHAAYGSPNLRHDTDVAEAALAELHERDAGAVGDFDSGGAPWPRTKNAARAGAALTGAPSGRRMRSGVAA